MTDLRTMIVEASGAVEKMFAKQGRISPMYDVHIGEMRIMIPAPPVEDKDLAVQLVRKLFEHVGVERYVFISEIWMLEKPADSISDWDLARVEREGIAKHPDRVERVMFMGEDASGHLMAYRKIIRPVRGRAKLGPLEFLDDIGAFEGRMVGLLPTTGMTKQ